MNAPITACECLAPGWCPRHRCRKTKHWFTLCRQRPAYFRLWESGKGPGQSAAGSRGGPITVLLVTHDRLDYTPRALEALLASDAAALEIVVWDNASTDGTREWLVERLRDESRATLVLAPTNVGVVRPMNVVWSTARGPYVAKVDNDTLIPPDLLRRLADRLAGDDRLGVISGCHFRPEDVSALGDHQEGAIAQVPNVGGCAVMMRTSKFQQAGPIPSGRKRGRGRTFLDSGWTAYQHRLDALGYVNGYPLPLMFVEHMEDVRSPYCNRSPEHEAYKVALRGLTLKQCTEGFYRHRRGERLSVESVVPSVERNNDKTPGVTLFVPLAGRRGIWPQLARFLDEQTWPHDRIELVLLDSSGDAEFGGMVGNWLAGCDYPRTRLLRQSVGAIGLADWPRREATRDVRRAMAEIYGILQRQLDTEYVWILEDDMLPPRDVCERLMRSLDPRTAAVAAPYRSRHHGRYVVWNPAGYNYERPGSGVEIVGGAGFGCMLLRASAIKRVAFPEEEDCDRGFCRRVTSNGLHVKADWTCESEHHPAEATVAPAPTAM